LALVFFFDFFLAFPFLPFLAFFFDFLALPASGDSTAATDSELSVCDRDGSIITPIKNNSHRAAHRGGSPFFPFFALVVFFFLALAFLPGEKTASG